MSLRLPLATTVPDDLHQEIMVRLPALPQPLARAAAVCPEWRRITRDPAFLRRHRELYGGVPVTAGFFYNAGGNKSRFVRGGDDPLSLSIPPSITGEGVTCCTYKRHGDGDPWTVLDCRGGRVLLGCCRLACYYLVWNPITRERRLIQGGSIQGSQFYLAIRSNATLICVPGDVDGGDGPFRVAVVYNTFFHADLLFGAVFCSRSGEWSSTEIFMEDLPSRTDLRGEPSAVVGNTVYTSVYNFLVVAFDTENWTMETFLRPRFGNVRLMKTRDGVLGIVGASDFTVRLWAREGGDWVLRCSVDLPAILRDLRSAPLPSSDPRFPWMPPVKIIGVADEGDAVFLWTLLGIFKFCPKSMELNKVCNAAQDMEIVHPYASFYTNSRRHTRVIISD